MYAPKEKRTKRRSSLSRQALKRDLGICQCCGRDESQSGKMEVHHIHPHYIGGEESLNNLITLCSICHRDAPNNPDNFLAYQRSGGRIWQWRLSALIISGLGNPEIEKLTLKELWERVVKFRIDTFLESYEQVIEKDL
jgi:hypothetical protein